MIPLNKLKLWLQGDYGRGTILAFILASFDSPTSIKSIKDRAIEVGYRGLRNANVSRDLNNSGFAIRVNDGWELSSAGINTLVEIGVKVKGNDIVELAIDLRDAANKILNEDTKSFVDETISAYENNLKRSSIVMSWLGAISILQNFVLLNHLSEFNIEARRRNPKWKTAKTVDDISLMKERDFLDITQHISVIGKDVKSALLICLTRRNSCGHPNSFKISDRIVAAHLEVLILNIYIKF